MNALLKKSTPGKFAYICHFQQSGINATVFEKREFILKLTFSLPLPSSMLKLSKVNREVSKVPREDPREVPKVNREDPRGPERTLERSLRLIEKTLEVPREVPKVNREDPRGPERTLERSLRLIEKTLEVPREVPKVNREVQLLRLLLFTRVNFPCVRT